MLKHNLRDLRDLALVAPTCCGARVGHASQRVWDQAEERQRPGARVAELVSLLGRHEDDRTGPQGVLLLALGDHSAALEHEDLMLVCVRMLWRVPAGLDVELSHRETGRVVLGPDQATDLTTDGSFRGHRRGGNLFAMHDFHPKYPFIPSTLVSVPSKLPA